MVFGESGILACVPPDRRPQWSATRRQLTWPNGAVAQIYSASDPESLRGQLGSDALMPAHWPAGSYFVLLDGAPQQIELAASGRNILQYFQIGPAARPYSDYSYRKLSAAFAGNGLRPYAPVHLDQKWDGTDVEFSWIRRARLDGASWDLAEIPLLETTERYQVKIFSSAQLLRQEEVSQAQWRYSAAMRSADGAHGLLELQVAQLSESFGPGLFRKLRFTA